MEPTGSLQHEFEKLEQLSEKDLEIKNSAQIPAPTPKSKQNPKESAQGNDDNDQKVFGYLKSGNGDVISFTRKENIIGRNEKECHVKIKSQSVSSQHALVRFVENANGSYKTLLTDLFRFLFISSKKSHFVKFSIHQFNSV